MRKVCVDEIQSSAIRKVCVYLSYDPPDGAAQNAGRPFTETMQNFKILKIHLDDFVEYVVGADIAENGPKMSNISTKLAKIRQKPG